MTIDRRKSPETGLDRFSIQSNSFISVVKDYWIARIPEFTLFLNFTVYKFHEVPERSAVLSKTEEVVRSASRRIHLSTKRFHGGNSEELLEIGCFS